MSTDIGIDGERGRKSLSMIALLKDYGNKRYVSNQSIQSALNKNSTSLSQRIAEAVYYIYVLK